MSAQCDKGLIDFDIYSKIVTDPEFYIGDINTYKYNRNRSNLTPNLARRIIFTKNFQFNQIAL